MLKRIITGVLFTIVFIGSIFLGNWYFRTLSSVMLLVSIYEYHKSTKANPLLWVLGYITSGLIILVYFVKFWYNIRFIYIYFFAVTLMLLLYMLAVLALHGKVKYTDVLSSFGFSLYVSIAFMLFMGLSSHSRSAIFIPIILAWVNDVFAYFGGTLFGKHKFTPVVSPKKTVEGSICGIVGAIGVLIAYAYLVNRFLGHPLVGNLWLLVGVCIPCAVAAQAGDLVASAIKRDIGIKDYGKILPGHGGVIDRFDSVLFIAPVVYMILIFVR